MDELDIRSGHELARRTETAPDGAVHQATIAKYRRGVAQVPDERTLRSLAHALQVPVRRLREAAGLPTEGPDEPFVLPPQADYLTGRERDAVLAVIRAFLDRRPPLRLVAEEVLSEETVDETAPGAESGSDEGARQPSGCGRNAT